MCDLIPHIHYNAVDTLLLGDYGHWESVMGTNIPLLVVTGLLDKLYYELLVLSCDQLVPSLALLQLFNQC